MAKAPLSKHGSSFVVAAGELAPRQFRVLSGPASQPYLVIDPDGVILEFSAACTALFGYASQDVVGRHLMEYMDEPMATERRASLKKQTDGLTEVYELHARHRNGDRFWVRVTAYPLFDEDDRFSGCLSTFLEITAEKTARQSAKRDQRLLQAAFDALPQSVFVRDKGSRYVHVNAAMARRYGLAPEDFIGKHVLDVPAGDMATRQRFLEQDRQALATGVHSFREDVSVRLPDGQTQYLNAVRLPLFNDAGDIEGVVGTAQDVTDYRRLLDELTFSEQKFAQIIDNSLEAIISIDQDCRIILYNQGAERVFGYASKEMLGKPLDELLPVRFRQSHVGHMQAFLQGGEAARPMSTRRQIVGLRENGEEFPAEATISKIVQQGRPVMSVFLRDVSEQRAAEKAREASERRFGKLFEWASEAIYVVDLESHVILDANVQACLNLEYSREELVGLRVEDIAGVKSGPAVFEQFDVLRREGQTRFRHVHRRKDGSEFPVEIHSRVIEVGDTSFIYTFVQDISQQVEAERALQKNMLLLQTVFDSVPVGLTVKDQERRYLMANQPVLDMLRVDADALIGHRLEELPDGNRWELDAARLTDERVLQDGKTVVTPDLRYEIPGEPDRWGRAIKTPLRDDTGQILGVVGVIQDITAQRQMVTDLRASEARLRQFSEASSDWLWEMDRDLRYTWMSPNVERIFGVPPEWHYGKTRQELAEDDDGAAWAAHLETMRQHKPFRDFQFLRRTQGRESRWVRTSGVPFFDAKGNFAGYRGSASDITAEKTMEEQLRQSQKLEAIGTLAGGIAHDFNNLLQPIIGFTKLSLDSLDAESLPARNLQAVLTAANRAKDIVAKILLFARNSPHAPTYVDVVPLAQELANLLRETLPASISIVVDSEPAPLPAFADASQIHQVLLNLCINAGHAMPDGGTIVLSLGQRRLAYFKTSTGATLNGSYIRLAVTDTGVGMSEEMVARIFEPFFSTRPMGQGTGLGLSSVLGIVENHQGAIHVRSVLGSGSVFEVYLPRAQASPSADEPPEDHPKASDTISVLVVDDDPMIAMLNKTILERRGYQVMVHTDSSDALEAFREAPDEVDLIVTDLSMPRLGGMQFIAAIRKQRQAIPIIVCTGYESQELLDAETALENLRVLTKPLEPDELVAAVVASMDAVAQPEQA